MPPPDQPRKPTASETALLAALYTALAVTEEKIEESAIKYRELTYVRSCWLEDEEGRQRFREFAEEKRYPIWDILTRFRAQDSVESVFREIDKAASAKEQALDAQSTLRQSIRELCRPFLRSLTIMDLPDEVLLDIFEELEGFTPDHRRWNFISRPGVNAIKNVRLVCRRFSNLSSRFLIRRVQVTPDLSSIAFLDQISRHPTIARGIRDIEVLLQFRFVSALDSFSGLIGFLREQLGNQLDRFNQVWARVHGEDKMDLYHKIMDGGTAAYLVLERMELQRDEEDGVQDAVEGDGEHLEFLQKVHDKRNMLVQEERSLVESGQFAEAIASAMARMPAARGLRLTDNDLRFRRDEHIISAEETVWEGIKRVALRPFCNQFRKETGLEDPDLGSVGQIINAARRAGVELESLAINLHSWGKPGSIMSSLGSRDVISGALKRLKRFSFDCEQTLDGKEVNEVEQLCSTFTGTPSLQRLELRLNRDEDLNEAPPWVNLTKILGTTMSRPKLVHLCLRNLAISHPIKLLRLLPSPMYSVYLSTVRLVGDTGTWRETLDALVKSACEWFKLRRPLGAECETWMTGANYVEVFGTTGDSTIDDTSQAERYVIWGGSYGPNPLKELEDRHTPEVETPPPSP
ncbi:hypothetical protein V8F20_009896 [Naviculisporaceae sp. PSN 640]